MIYTTNAIEFLNSVIHKATERRKLFPRETLIKSFDRLRTNGKLLIPFVVSLSNHEWNQFVQRFPSDQSVLKVVYPAIYQTAKKWSMPIRDWKSALNRFMIFYQDRITEIF